MNTTEPTVIEPAAGCSPAGGLPRQGRRGESHGGSGKDAVSAAVPGSFEPEVAVDRRMAIAYSNVMFSLGEMAGLLRQHPTALSMKQCLYYHGELDFVLRHFKSSAIESLKNDFPPVIRGYKDIPE